MALETWIMVGDAGGIEPASRDLRAPTRPMARAPTGNAKTHSTPSHDDGVEHKELLSPPPPQVTDTMVMQLW